MPEHVIRGGRDLRPGERLAAELAGRQVALFNVGGELRLVLNRCPHQGGPVCRGGLFGLVRADVDARGRIRESIEGDACILACPWHGWEFDLRTGRSVWNPRFRLRTYPVRIDGDGEVVADL